MSERNWQEKMLCEQCGYDITSVCNKAFKQNPYENPQVVVCPACGFHHMVGMKGKGIAPLNEEKIRAMELEEVGIHQYKLMARFDRVRVDMFGKEGFWQDNIIHFTDGSEFVVTREQAQKYVLPN